MVFCPLAEPRSACRSLLGSCNEENSLDTMLCAFFGPDRLGGTISRSQAGCGEYAENAVGDTARHELVLAI